MTPRPLKFKHLKVQSPFKISSISLKIQSLLKILSFSNVGTHKIKISSILHSKRGEIQCMGFTNDQWAPPKEATFSAPPSVAHTTCLPGLGWLHTTTARWCPWWPSYGTRISKMLGFPDLPGMHFTNGIFWPLTVQSPSCSPLPPQCLLNQYHLGHSYIGPSLAASMRYSPPSLGTQLLCADSEETHPRFHLSDNGLSLITDNFSASVDQHGLESNSFFTVMLVSP